MGLIMFTVNSREGSFELIQVSYPSPTSVSIKEQSQGRAYGNVQEQLLTQR